MKEQLKTLLLAGLVITSIFLSLALWTFTPQFEAINGPQFANNAPVIDPTYQRTIGNLNWPREVILHLGENKHVAQFPGESGYEETVNLLRAASFVDIELSTDYGDNEWLRIVQTLPSVQVEFDATLPITALEKSEIFKFTSRLEPTLLLKTLYLFPSGDENVMRALFHGGTENRMYQARVVLPKERYDQLLASVKDGPFVTLYGQSINRNFYLPSERRAVNEYVMNVYQDVQLQRLVDSFFLDQSLTRRVIERDNSQIFTDGSRRVRVGARDFLVDFRQLNIDKTKGKGFDLDFAMTKAIQFVNEHGGFSGNYRLHEVPYPYVGPNYDVRSYEYRPIVNGHPLIGSLAAIELKVAGYDVAAMKRSIYSVSTRPYRELGKREVLSGPELLQILDRSAWLDRNRVNNIYLAYLTSGPQDGLATLRPVWIVEQSADSRFGLFDAVSGERLREEEGLLRGLE